MRRRQPCPRLWLMTDERLGEGLWAALDRLPRGAGIVFRHHQFGPVERRALFERVRQVARRRGLVLILAGPDRLARAWKADGSHNRARLRETGGLRSAPVHSLRELRQRRGADILFVSPLRATRSHPGARLLGGARFATIARLSRAKVIALGGMDWQRWPRAKALGADGWAGIDAWQASNQKRKAVPI